MARKVCGLGRWVAREVGGLARRTVPVGLYQVIWPGLWPNICRREEVKNALSSSTSPIRAWIFLAMATVGVLLVGCIRSTGDLRGLTHTGSEQDDFPVPPNFDLLGSPVEYRPVLPTIPGISDFRSWTARYIGQSTLGEIAPFYVREMPSLGWTVGDIRNRGSKSKLLTFFKGDDQATVSLYRKFSGKLGGMATIIEGHIGPRSVENFTVGGEADARGAAPVGASGRQRATYPRDGASREALRESTIPRGDVRTDGDTIGIPTSASFLEDLEDLETVPPNRSEEDPLSTDGDTR